MVKVILKENLYELATNIVYEVANKEKLGIEFTLSKSDKFSKIDYGDIIKISVPYPKQIQDKLEYQGILFDNIDSSFSSVWSLFLSSLYHLGAHAAVTDYSAYKNWTKTKSPILSSKVIKIIEDFRVKEFLKSRYSNPYQNIEMIEFSCQLLYHRFLKNELDEKQQIKTQNLLKTRINSIQKEMIEVIQDNDSIESRVKLADKLYHNRSLLDIWEYPYKENIRPTNFTKYLKYFKHEPNGEFSNYVNKIGEMWINELKNEERIMKKYEKYAEELHFDRIVLSAENLGKYFQLRMDSSNMIKKIRNQVKMITNSQEDPNTEDYGHIEMQKAIQAVASETQGISYFEQDQELRYEESWAIVMDTSASMKIQFQDLQRFLLCIAEAADQINSKGGKWAIHGFNNNFVLVKDFKERYNDKVRARIGGLENSGLSFIPDAMKLAIRMLEDDINERRYLFLITDGYSAGYHEIDQEFQSAIKLASRAGINVIAIGVPDGMSKYFTISFPHIEVRKTVANFINAYSSLAQQMM